MSLPKIQSLIEIWIQSVSSYTAEIIISLTFRTDEIQHTRPLFSKALILLHFISSSTNEIGNSPYIGNLNLKLRRSKSTRATLHHTHLQTSIYAINGLIYRGWNFHIVSFDNRKVFSLPSLSSSSIWLNHILQCHPIHTFLKILIQTLLGIKPAYENINQVVH